MDTSMINLIETQMAMHLDPNQQKILHDTLVQCFAAQEIQKREDDNRHLVSVFLAAKRVEGCSEKTVRYYDSTPCKFVTVKILHHHKRFIRSNDGY